MSVEYSRAWTHCVQSLVLACALGGLACPTAHAASRMVLGEHFTREGCSYCALAGPAQVQMLENYPTTYICVQYHWGNSSDPHLTAFGSSRATYYGAGGTPSAYFDGVLSVIGASSTTSAYANYNNAYNTRRAVATKTNIQLGGSALGGANYRIQARVSLEAGAATTSMRVYITQVINNWPTSPTYSRNTFKQAAATQDLTLAAGQTQVITRDFTLDSDSVANLSKVRIIAWAQSTTGKEVYQAAVMSYPFVSLDCNNNGILDSTDIANCDGSIWCSDCNSNGVPDGCDVADGAAPDCNSNGIPDECDLAAGQDTDCNGNGIPDACDLAACDGSPWCGDCNSNGILDVCDIAAGTVTDCNTNGVPDACDATHCDGSAWCSDCNANGVLDGCDVNGIPFAQTSPDLAPFDYTHPQQHTLTTPPDALGNVTLTFVGFGDFNFYNESVALDLNGLTIGQLFSVGMDCVDVSESITLTDAVFNAAKAGGDATIHMIPASAVDPNWCPGGSRIRVTVTYRAVPVSTDANTNGVPDECEAPPLCHGDANCDAAINWRDIDFLIAAMNDNQSAWAALFNPAPACSFANVDTDLDGHVSWRDIDPFVALMNTTCPH